MREKRLPPDLWVIDRGDYNCLLATSDSSFGARGAKPTSAARDRTPAMRLLHQRGTRDCLPAIGLLLLVPPAAARG